MSSENRIKKEKIKDIKKFYKKESERILMNAIDQNGKSLKEYGKKVLDWRE